MATVAEPKAEQRLGERDCFTDPAVLKDPYDHFEAVHGGPARRTGRHRLRGGAGHPPRRCGPLPGQLRAGRRPAAAVHAFGRGTHVCAGAPLARVARVAVRIILEKFLEHMGRIDFGEAEHGPTGARTIDYEPGFIIRGVAKMHLVLAPR